MLNLAIWMFVATLLALWSLTAWALHAVSVWAVTHAGAIGGTAAGVGGLSLPAWLAPWVSAWVPPEFVQATLGLLSGLEPIVHAALQAAPALAGGITVLAWVTWGVGCVVLVGLGVASHLLIARWQRRVAGHTGARANERDARPDATATPVRAA